MRPMSLRSCPDAKNLSLNLDFLLTFNGLILVFEVHKIDILLEIVIDKA